MKIIRLGFVSLLFASVCLTNAVAADKPEDLIKYRHAVMEAMSSHVSAILLLATNKIDGQQYLQGHADSLANLSSQLDMLFPESTVGGDTHALPAILSDSDKFAAAIAETQKATDALQSAAASGKPVMGAFASVGKSCKGCHESFRAEHDDEESD